MVLSAILILFISSQSTAKQFYKAEIFFKTGEIKEGYIPEVRTLGYENIPFRKSEKSQKSEEQELQVSEVTKVVYLPDSTEYHLIRAYSGRKKKPFTDPMWAELVKEDIVSLYVISSELQAPGTRNLKTGLTMTQPTSATFKTYFVVKMGEPAATCISYISDINNNRVFRLSAPMYFSEYEELADKIKKKEYKWKDLEEVVALYNTWLREQGEYRQ